MGPATQSGRQRDFSSVLAGLQAGMAAAFVMLGWLGFSSALERRSFWAPENLMASAISGRSPIRSGFAFSTVSGLSLYLGLYGLLGALFALLVGGKLRHLRLLLFGAFFGLCWYYLSFRLIWKNVSPLVTLLHDEHPTMLANVIYGMMLARFPLYLGRGEAAVPKEMAAAVPLVSSGQIMELAASPQGGSLDGAVPEGVSPAVVEEAVPEGAPPVSGGPTVETGGNPERGTPE
jgi:hypothetical protein